MSLPETDLSQNGARTVFVYYRVHPSKAAALQQAFAAVAAGMRDWQPRLMRKVADDDREAAAGEPADQREHRNHQEQRNPQDQRLQTFMEVYRPPVEAARSNGAMRALIDGCARSAGLFELIEGERHFEIFEPCA
jgi:hypothetical protein